jgi:hypothetical protein
MNADYHLISHWRVPGARDDVVAILRAPRDLVRPEVYLAVEIEERDDGEVVHVRTRGRLPYTLRWRLRAP